MTYRLRQALNSAKERQVVPPEVDEILDFWGGKFGSQCPYNPSEVRISADRKKLLLVPQQQASSYESVITNNFESTEDTSRSISITRLPKRQQSMPPLGTPRIDEDMAVIQIRAALLSASLKAAGSENLADQEQFLATPIAGNRRSSAPDNLKKLVAETRKSLVRGTRTTLLHMRKVGAYDNSRIGTPISVTRAQHLQPEVNQTGEDSNKDDQTPCKDLVDFALFVAPAEDADHDGIRRPNMPHPSRRSVRDSSNFINRAAGARKKFSLKVPPPSFKSKKELLRLARAKLNSRTISSIGPISETSEVGGNIEAANVQTEVYVVGDTVEARYRGRSAFLPGKVTRVLANGTYDIQYLHADEKGVRPDFIRRKTLDVRRVKAKLRISGMLVAAMGTDEEGHATLDGSMTSPLKTQNSPSKEKMESKRGSTAGHLEQGSGEVEETHTPLDNKKAWKGALHKSLLVSGGAQGSFEGNAPQSTPGKTDSRRLNLLKEEEEKKKLLEALAEQERKKKEEAENKEKLRLWAEMKRLVIKYQCEINKKHIAIQDVIGRGKFAAVHKGKLLINDKPGHKRGAPQGMDELVGMSSVWSVELNVAFKVTQFQNALPLPKEFSDPLDESVAKKLELDNNVDGEYSDDGDFEDEPNPAVLPPSKTILEFMREIRALTILKHENICTFHGVLLEPRLCVALQLMEGKNLYQHLQDPDWQTRTGYLGRLEILLDISKALSYMHGLRYIHRDIKPHNILFVYGAGGVTSKLSDFGSCIRIPGSQMLTDQMGTSGYTAPEVFDPQKYNLSADVYSFGILAWDLFFSQENSNPFVGIDPDDFVRLAMEGVRPTMNVTSMLVSSKLNSMISSCWTQDPESRPAMAAVEGMIGVLISDHYDHGQSVPKSPL